MQHSPSIRLYCEGDLPHVVELEQQVFDFPQSERQILSLLGDKEHCLIVELGSQVIGFAFVRAVLDEAELLNIGLSSAYQGSGIADNLFDELLQRLQKNKITSIYLEVRKSNLRAIAFYRRKGFEEIGNRSGYYPLSDGGKEDALLMRKSI